MRWLFIVLFMALASSVMAQENEVAGSVGPNREEKSDGRADSQKAKTNGFLVPVRIVESQDEAARRAEREQASDQHEKDDLNAQKLAAISAERAAASAERQEDIAFAQAILSVVGMLLLAVSVWFTAKATNAATKATEIANSQFIAEHRPWLKFTQDPKIVYSVRDEGEDGGIRDVLKIEATMENIGSSPAVGVTCHAIVTEFKSMLFDVSMRKNIKDVSASELKVAKIDSGATIFPGAKVPLNGWNSELIDLASNAVIGDTFLIIVCVTYFMLGKDQTGEARSFHTTIVARVDPSAIRANDGNVGEWPVLTVALAETITAT